VTGWEWWAGAIGEYTYDIGNADTREAVIAQALAETVPGEQFQIIEAKSSDAAKYEGADHVPFLRQRNHEVLTNGPEATAIAYAGAQA
jgi:hypothetical protein